MYQVKYSQSSGKSHQSQKQTKVKSDLYGFKVQAYILNTE